MGEPCWGMPCGSTCTGPPLLPLHILHDLLRVLWVEPMVRWLLWWRRHMG